METIKTILTVVIYAINIYIAGCIIGLLAYILI